MKKLILSTILLSTLIISCKKSNADNPSPSTVPCTTVPVIATRNSDTSSAFFYMLNSSKIGKIQNYDGAGTRNGYIQYAYNNDIITEADYYQNGNINGGRTEYHLDSKGRIKMETYYETFTSSNDTIFFQYDVNGNNTYRIHKSVGTVTTTDTVAYSYINNFRVVSGKIKNGKSVDRHDYTYTSSPDKVGYNDLSNIFIGQTRIPGKGLFGNIGTDLIAKDTYTDTNNSSNSYVGSFTYEFDSNGNPIKVTYAVVAGAGGVSFTDVTNYTYACK